MFADGGVYANFEDGLGEDYQARTIRVEFKRKWHFDPATERKKLYLHVFLHLFCEVVHDKHIVSEVKYYQLPKCWHLYIRNGIVAAYVLAYVSIVRACTLLACGYLT